VRLQAPRIFFERGEGPWLVDVDGNRYVDYLLGQGPNILGHAPARVQAAVSDAARSGLIFGAQHPLEVDAAEAFRRATEWPQMLRFGMTGTESVQAALRVARAATGKRLVIRFEGHYHGWLDDVLTGVEDGRPVPASKGQLASRLDDSLLLPWNDVAVLRDALAARGGEVAAVLTEPMMLNAGAIAPRPGYLEALRQLCDQHHVVLIFDEVITGFRLALGGAVERFGVEPDLAVFGKAVGAGWPVSVLAGRRDLLADVGTGAINVSGTFNGSVMAMAAVCASLAELSRPGLYHQMADHGEQLIETIRRSAAAARLPVHVQGLPQAFHVSYGRREHDIRDFAELQDQDAAAYQHVVSALMQAGVWVSGRGIWYVSAAHDEQALAAAAAGLEYAFAAISRR
jgi:glutamate-1-semialdehyde 2,1-aminomutase